MKNNKTYKQMYDELIQFRQNNIIPQDQLGENHHIKPKSLFPELINDKNNIVRLTLKEHFLAHLYLYLYSKHELNNKNWVIKTGLAILRMIPKQYKKIFNIDRLSENQLIIISETIEELKIMNLKRFNEMRKNIYKDPEKLKNIREKISLKAKNRYKDKNERIKTGESLKEVWKRPGYKERLSKKLKGQKRSEKTKQKISEILKKYYSYDNNRKKLSDNIKRYYENNPDAIEINRQSHMFQAKIILQYDISGKFLNEWCSVKQAARKLNIKHQSIIACLKGKNRTAGGFKWKYKKPIDSKN